MLFELCPQAIMGECCPIIIFYDGIIITYRSYRDTSYSYIKYFQLVLFPLLQYCGTCDFHNREGFGKCSWMDCRNGVVMWAMQSWATSGEAVKLQSHGTVQKFCHWSISEHLEPSNRSLASSGACRTQLLSLPNYLPETSQQSALTEVIWNLRRCEFSPKPASQ